MRSAGTLDPPPWSLGDRNRPREEGDGLESQPGSTGAWVHPVGSVQTKGAAGYSHAPAGSPGGSPWLPQARQLTTSGGTTALPRLR